MAHPALCIYDGEAGERAGTVGAIQIPYLIVLG